MLVHEVDPYNAEPPAPVLAEHVITPIASFYGRNHGPMPEVDPATWRLRVDGLVDRALELSLAELQRFTRHTETATLQCAGNRRAGLQRIRDVPGHPWGAGATSTASWTGARLGDVLAAAGVRAPARDVAFAGSDVSPQAEPPQAFGGSIGLEKATAPETLLVWAMNGEALPRAHGGPVRVLVPGYIGARSVKWLERVTVRDRPSDNFFQRRAYRLRAPDETDPAAGMALGAVALNADFLSPTDGARLDPGPVELVGYAFAGGDRTVERVDVSPDGGATWARADLDPAPSRWSWRFWRCTVALGPGRHRLVARAWDSSAALQPEHAASVWNPAGYVNNAWPEVTVHVGDA